MAERDITPVKVTLDRQRLYRVNDEDKVAIAVGPGEAEVPTWVAEHWGLIPGNAMPAGGESSGPEKQLEAETGHDVVKTGDNPPTFVETDKPAPKGKQAG